MNDDPNPDNPAAPAEPTEAQPPEGYEPQVELAPEQEPGIRARPGDGVADAEAEEPNVTGDGDAASDDDDKAVDDPSGD